MTLRIYCPSCQAEIRNDSGICSTCGLTLNELQEDATRRLSSDKPAAEKPASGKSHKTSSFDSIDDARFVPGAILAERYRIVGLLGKGGMGEVYRADDLKLGQPVALKFLPDHLLSDGAALARFHREVRVARQVSHKNVCRVYDIGETEGRHFLSMEYIKGEELSSLLRRIGRVPADKAVQLARQICAGLNAAHDIGVLHRDLKPANVMIDSDGNARILDFGLAGLAEEFGEDEMRAGTPAYMAPEQLEGKPFTSRSDIYSLGLLLYELFTSRKAFDAATLEGLIKLRRSNTLPTTPTSIVKDLDPLIERVIDRCMQSDPSLRPASAVQVAAALPGGDPIAAALAAGETPSPEMVAAAPKKGTLRPPIALALLGSTIFFLALTMFLSKFAAGHRFVPLQKSPAVLDEQAKQMISSLGYRSAPMDVASGFEMDREYTKFLRDSTTTFNTWEALKFAQPALIRYWYRQSPGVLFPYSEQLVTSWDPPKDVPGMVLLRLDTEGKLNYFEAAPEQVPSSESQVSSSEPRPSARPLNPSGLETRNLKLGTGASELETGPAELESRNSKLETDLWSALFGAAGLDINKFQPTESLWTPPHAYDARQAWTGFYPNLPNVPIRVEAASFHNRPVYFTIVSPWNKPVSERADPRGPGEKIGVWILFAIFFGILVVGALLALRNLRLGRGDRRGAFRLALFVFLSRILVWIFSTHHVADNVELLLLVTGIQSALFWSCFVGVMYLALEPYLRRRWPEKIISWNRLLVGDFRDPLVGRDILVGLAIGAFCVLLMYLRVVLPYWIASFRSMPDFTDGFEFGLSGASAFLQMFINQVTASMIQTFMVVFLLLFLTLLFRKEWLGVTVGTLIWIAFFFSSEVSYTHWIGLVCIALAVISFVFCAENFGPVALMSALMVFHLWVFYPITTDLGAWYASTFVLCTLILLALAVYAFYTSLGGQRVFKRRLLQED